MKSIAINACLKYHISGIIAKELYSVMPIANEKQEIRAIILFLLILKIAQQAILARNSDDINHSPLHPCRRRLLIIVFAIQSQLTSKFI
jgi:hypothetical protein